jgi:hypothetical protein
VCRSAKVNYVLMHKNFMCSTETSLFSFTATPEDYQGDDMGGGDFDSGEQDFFFAYTTESKYLLRFSCSGPAEQSNRAGARVQVLADSIKKILLGRETKSSWTVHQSRRSK